jgi:hypothetical protein
MTMRKHTPMHDFWHRKVEGQIRDAIHHHPEWFNFPTPVNRNACINGLAKRIVGEIVAGYGLATTSAGVAVHCSCSKGAGGVGKDVAGQGKGGSSCASPACHEAAAG